MAISNRIEGLAGGSRGGSNNVLGSPKSRAQLAVSQNKKALAEAERKAKNKSIKDKVTKKK